MPTSGRSGRGRSRRSASSISRSWRSPWLRRPLASVSILAGLKTSAILTVGTATLAAFVGGGGYGTLIVRGLALDDVATILAGAIPAALMALLLHALFEIVDRLLIPRGLRLSLSTGPLTRGDG